MQLDYGKGLSTSLNKFVVETAQAQATCESDRPKGATKNLSPHLVRAFGQH